MEEKSVFERISCKDVDCNERVDCCTTVRWKISEHDYHDEHFREWWILHEGARLYEELGQFYIQWPMRCRYASDDGLRCLEYDKRPKVCRLYVCHRMADMPGNP